MMQKTAVRLTPDGRELILASPTKRGYRIRTDDCRSDEALLAWVRHLAAKRWVTRCHIHDLVTLAQEARREAAQRF